MRIATAALLAATIVLACARHDAPAISSAPSTSPSTPPTSPSPPPASASPGTASPADAAAAFEQLNASHPVTVDWPAVARTPDATKACATADVPFGETCPRAALDCTLKAEKRRVHCNCVG